MSEHHVNALPKGYRLREYELVRVLGFGGFGLTYLGFDHNLDKGVALKEYLPSDIAARSSGYSVGPQASTFREDFEWGLRRFLDEARTLARFDHRQIVKVHQFFEAHGTAYIVMEYAEGETLSERLARQGTLSEAELLAMVLPLLDGLDVVHRANVLHRDIKPGNIIIRDEDGSPVLLDFGSARQAIGAKSRSVTSVVTPGYAPIEQYSTRGEQGPWTDLYALGGVCYRALTGQVPEDATDRMLDDRLVSVGALCGERVSAGVADAIDWALSVNKDDRPQSIGAWRGALLGSAPVAAAIPTASEPVASAAEPSDSSARPSAAPVASAAPVFGRVFWVVLGLCLALGVGVVGVDWGLGQIEQARQEQAAAKRQAAEAHERAAEAARQAELERQRQAAAQALAAAQVAEAERQAALERERKAEAERQVALERQRKAEAERQAAAQALAAAQTAEAERQVALERQRKAEAERQAVLERERKAAAAARKRAAERQRKAGLGKTFSLPGGALMEFVWIPPGRFRMGSPSGEGGRDSDEGPLHEVELSRGFWLGKYEVAQGEWEAVIGSRPWRGKDNIRSGSSRPAIYISWDDVQGFIEKLNDAAGSSVYRLPTEAEWEYACRAGTQTRWSFGDGEHRLTDYAWYGANAWDVNERYGHVVGLKRANPWGLYDMHGNVWEWVQDWYGRDYYKRSPRVDPPGPTSGSVRVARGGAFNYYAQNVRSATRGYAGPVNRSAGVGVRLLRIDTP